MKAAVRMRAPFRPFFLLAALDAILGAAIWALPMSGVQLLAPLGMPANEWHRNVLLFGTVPTILAGFLLTALPRWTRRPPVSRCVVQSLAALWLAGRATFLFVRPDGGLVLFALFVLWLAVLVARPVIAARDRRNLKIVLLLFIYCASIALTAMSCELEIALRMALASVVSLVAIIGGRVVPALTEAYIERGGGGVVIASPAAVERLAAAATACVLVGWIAMPHALLTGVACAVAACAHTVRLAQWRAWRTVASPAILTLHVGYAWIIVGFALLAAHILAPQNIGRAAAIHAWMIGAVATMGLAIMASMIRKHAGRAFAPSRPATSAFALIFFSALSRLLVELLPSAAALFTTLAAISWIAAFALFLAAFRRMLLFRDL